MTGLQVASPTRSGQLQLDGGGVDAGPVEELLVHDGAGVVQGGTDDPATLKSALQSPFLSIHRSHTVSGTAHFCWKHPLLTFAHTSPSYSDSLIHSSFSPLALGSFHNGAIWQSCCQIAGKAGAPAGRHIALSFMRQLAPDPHDDDLGTSWALPGDNMGVTWG